MTACEAGVARANFTSQEAGAQRGQVVFPPTLLGGRDAVSNDKVSTLGTDSVLPWEH